MIEHVVRVQRPGTHLAREDQLAWKLACVASDGVAVESDVVAMVANRIIDNAKNNLVKAGKFDTGSAPTNSDTSIGWSPDGREVMQRPDGSKYLK